MKKIAMVGIVAWIILWFAVSEVYDHFLVYMDKGSMFIDYSAYLVMTALFLISGAFLGSLLLKRHLEK